MGCAPSRLAVQGRSAKQITPAGHRLTFAGDEAEYAELREKLFSHAGNGRELKPGDVLIEEGTTASSFFYIRNGTVAIKTKLPDGSVKARARYAGR
ncbi:hypothetical protein T492DRAFT_61353 [Pavlovales sp. CCMP2436]|nr:hypothetical protein T492DRAFT_61353 [Pavlovales sp. CCMP2436]